MNYLTMNWAIFHGADVVTKMYRVRVLDFCFWNLFRGWIDRIEQWQNEWKWSDMEMKGTNYRLILPSFMSFKLPRMAFSCVNSSRTYMRRGWSEESSMPMSLLPSVRSCCGKKCVCNWAAAGDFDVESRSWSPLFGKNKTIKLNRKFRKFRKSYC